MQGSTDRPTHQRKLRAGSLIQINAQGLTRRVCLRRWGDASVALMVVRFSASQDTSSARSSRSRVTET